jgi:hypothetical protein
MPTGRGLLAYRNMDEALAGVAEIDGNYAQHSKAAREIAEDLVDSRKALVTILSAAGWCTSRSVCIVRDALRDNLGLSYPLPWEAFDTHSHPLMDPPRVPAVEASHMRDDDLVLGISIEGLARAYPWWIMDGHHVANDTLGNRPILVVLCENCATGMAFDPVVGDRRLTFEVRAIYNGTIALRDHQTGSGWSPYFASAIGGELKGTELDVIPISQLTWELWRRQHPDTTVLDDEPGAREGHGSDWTILTRRMPLGFEQTVGTWDTRLAHYTLVLGVVTPDGQRAYRLSTLRRRRGVINDQIGSEPILTVMDLAKGSYAAAAYSRLLEGRALTFRRAKDGIIDRNTGSTWTPDGAATAGPLAGSRLKALNSHVGKWYVWAAHYPGIPFL